MNAMIENHPLTERQIEILDFIEAQIAANGYPPSVREIGSRFGIKSPNGVTCHLKALEKKGLITRREHTSRSIKVERSTDSPATLIHGAGI